MSKQSNEITPRFLCDFIKSLDLRSDELSVALELRYKAMYDFSELVLKLFSQNLYQNMVVMLSPILEKWMSSLQSKDIVLFDDILFYDIYSFFNNHKETRNVILQ